jgi:hypothetical protein
MLVLFVFYIIDLTSCKGYVKQTDKPEAKCQWLLLNNETLCPYA